MATGDKKGVVMQSDVGVAGGIAGYDATTAALAEKALAGYGWGEQKSMPAPNYDANQCLVTGLYAFGTNSTNLPEQVLSYQFGNIITFTRGDSGVVALL